MRAVLLSMVVAGIPAVMTCRPGEEPDEPAQQPRSADRVDHDLTTGRLKATETTAPEPDALRDLRDSPWVARYEVWDRDDDFVITTEEWREAFDGDADGIPWFGRWDTDADDELSDAELGTGLSASWDVDGDQVIDRWEYLQGARMFLARPTAHGSFSDLDQDDSGTLEPGELGTVAAASFAHWDADDSGRVTRAEWSEALFRTWDVNGDGRIEIHEARIP